MKISKPYKWAFVLLFIFLLIAIAGNMGRKESRDEATLETVFLGDLSQRIDDFHLNRFSGENMRWEIGAKTAVIRNGEEDASINDIEIVYTPQDGTPIHLSAERGKYNLSSNNFYIEKVEKEIRIQVGEGITIKGGRLEWSEKKREIESPGEVHVAGEKFVLEGEDLLANVDSGVYEIRKNIRARIW